LSPRSYCLKNTRDSGLTRYGLLKSGFGDAMKDFINRPGFLGTHAILLSDLTLILILLTAIMFTIGWQLARRKQYQSHQKLEAVSVCLNAIVVLAVMINSFAVNILPGLPGKLLEGSYGVTNVHAIVGLLGLVLGIFVVLRGNKLVPKRLRFKNYKPFMRTTYALYMLATFIGVAVYIEAFVFGI
jgi:uncharacterized membrane protein YozB (DUF420 family)